MKRLFLFFLVLSISLATFGLVSAATSIPGGPFSSSFHIQNIGTGQAHVTVKYYDATGTEIFTSGHTIEVDDVLSVYMPSVGISTGEYSMVISSDQPVAASSTFGDIDSLASYSGFGAGATSWFIPGIYDNFYAYYSEVYAQNVSGSPADVTISIYAPGSDTAVYTNTKNNVPANASVVWNQAALAELNKNIPYSAKVTSTSNFVAMANIYGSGTVAKQLYSYNGFPSGGKKYYTPVVLKNYYGWNASIVIQNTSSLAASVTVSYSPGYSKSYIIQPNSLISIYVPAEKALPSGTKGLFGATITSDQDIAVMVNQSNKYNRAATYNGILEATTTVNAPNVMKRYNNLSSSVTCQNVGDVDTTMTISFANQPAATRTSGTIVPGSFWSVYLPAEAALPNNFSGSSVIKSNSTAPIACIINSNMEDAPYNTRSMDVFTSYNAINE